MKQNVMKCILAAEAAACVAFCFLRMGFSWLFSGIAAFPFEQAGWGLRKLSLSGEAGNAAAVILYGIFSLIPALVWLFLKKQRRELRVDLVLPGLSVLLFIVNYYMINPSLLPSRVPGTGKWVLGCTFYSVLFGYLVIRTLEVYREVDAGKLQRGLKGLLWFLNMVFVYAICRQCLEDTLLAAGNLRGTYGGMLMEGFVSGGEPTGAAYLFLVLRYIVNILPYVFDMGIVFLGGYVLDALNRDRYSDESIALVKRLAGFCQRALAITVMANAVFNLLQCLFSGSLSDISIVIRLPVLSIIFVLAVLLFSRYLCAEQKLKQEHDLII